MKIACRLFPIAGYILSAIVFLCGPLARGELTIEELRKSAEQGNAHAQFRVGRIYDEKYFFLGVEDKDSDVDSRIRFLKIKQDSAEAVKWYHKAAEQGHAEAQVRLGVCYTTREGVELDFAVGMKWFRKAAEQGDAHGQYMLGTMFASGIGVQEDVVEAMKWFRKAAKQGHVSAQSEINSRDDKGDLTPESNRENIEALGKFLEENGGKEGNGQIEFEMGEAYQKGEDVQKDPSEAVKWFRKAAEKGHADAQFRIGGCYAQSVGVEEDKDEAFKWTRKAAEQGHVKAQAVLGGSYFIGSGVVKNEMLGYQWILLASANGNEDAIKIMAIVENRLTAEQRAEGQRLATEWQTDFDKKQGEK